MRELGLAGDRRGTRRRTTIADPAAARPADLVQRRFFPARRDAVWVARLQLRGDLVGHRLRRLRPRCPLPADPGLASGTSMRTELVLDALEQAIWTRASEGVSDLSGLACHHDAGRSTAPCRSPSGWPAPALRPASARSATHWGDALAETHIGLFTTELIRRRGPWRGLDDVELATLEWVDWHNNRRLHTACHDLTPVEYEQVYYGHHPAQERVEVSTP
jgi:putative transposase